MNNPFTVIGLSSTNIFPLLAYSMGQSKAVLVLPALATIGESVLLRPYLGVFLSAVYGAAKLGILGAIMAS